MNSSDLYDVLAGTVIAAHGVQGGIKIRLATKTALPLITAGTGVSRKPVEVWIGSAPKADPEAASETGKMATLTQVKEMQAGGSVYLAKVLGVRDRSQAEALIGKLVFAPESRRVPLAENEFFVNDLIRLTVVGDAGQDYGKITNIHQHPGNDVYETDQGALIPAVKEVVTQVDVVAGRVQVHEMIGLRPDEAEEVRAENEVGPDAGE